MQGRCIRKGSNYITFTALSFGGEAANRSSIGAAAASGTASSLGAFGERSPNRSSTSSFFCTGIVFGFDGSLDAGLS